MQIHSLKSLLGNIRLFIILIPLFVYSDHLFANQAKLLILGDSLSAAYGLKQEQGWVSLLQNAWQEQVINVVNAAISGETTDGGLSRLPRLLEQHSPSHLLIEWGGNDGLQGHSIKKMHANLANMIELAQQQNIKVLLQAMQIPTNYGRRYNQMFTDTYVELANQYDIQLIPFLLTEVALDPTLMQNDGIHPNLKAQPMIAEFMNQQLLPLVKP